MFVKIPRFKRGDIVYEYLNLVEAERRNGEPAHRWWPASARSRSSGSPDRLDRVIAATLRRYTAAGRARIDEIDATGPGDRPDRRGRGLLGPPWPRQSLRQG